MRRFGPTLEELVLTDALACLGLGLVAVGAAGGIAPDRVLPGRGVTGGMLAGVTGSTGLVLALAGAGVRQNRPALELGHGMLCVVAPAWLTWVTVGHGRRGAAQLATTGFLVTGLASLSVLRRAAVRARFRPRFLSPRSFETMVMVADTMIDADGRMVGAPEDVAIAVDHLLDEIRTPVTQEIKQVLLMVEWLLPLMIFRPFPFSSLGSSQRRRVVRRVINAKGPFRDVARSLKVLTSVGYYGSDPGMSSIGYVPYEDTSHGRRTHKTPKVHDDPFPPNAPRPGTATP